MPAVPGVHDATDNTPTINKTGPTGNWEIHSSGDGAVPGMAVISAITTLQVGATLATTPADKIAMSEAAEYLRSALAPQLKSFRRRLSKPLPSLQRALF
jgi:hypothetical protein